MTGATTDPILRLRAVSRVFHSGDEQVRALDAVSFDVVAGELVAVMGPSGSGKSTLLAIAGGLDRADSGAVEVEGVALDTLGPTATARLRRDRIGYVFQNFNLVTDLTAAENVALPRELAGVPARQARREAISALAEVGIEALAPRFPVELSGGQRQRVAIARALAPEPGILIADEPVSMLDVSIRLGVLNLLAALQQEEDLGVLYITHDLATARHFSDEILVMYQGRIVERGPADDVILHPRHEYTRTLADAAPNPERRLRQARS